MNNLNEEINYIKYLLSYQKGKVLSEQKLILEQATKADYDQIASSLDESYKTVFEKYSFTGITFFGIDSKNDLISDYTGTPTVVGLKLPFEAESSMDGKFNYTYMTCSPQQIKSTKTRGVIFSVVDPINNSTNSGILASLYTKKAIKRDKITNVTEAIENKYKSQYFNTSKSIFNEACKLIKSKSEGNDVTKDLEKIYTVNNPKKTTTAQQQTTTTQTTTQTKNTPIGQIGTNRYKDPLFTVTEIPQYKKWVVEGFCSLPTGSADAGTFDELLIEKIKNAVNNAKDPKLQANKQYITLTFAEVRGTASNNWGGPISYNAEFDGYNWRSIKEVDPENKTENYTKNINLAKKRANEILTKIKNDLPIADKNGTKIKVNKSLVKSDVKSYSVNTGGISDSGNGRDWNTYPLPGQSIYVKLTIKLQGPPPDKLKSVSCLTNAKITVGYFPIGSSINKGQKDHNCDTATFDVYMNDKIISTVDLGNGILLNDGTQCNNYPDYRVFCQTNRNFKNLSNTITDNKIGGMRYAEVIISGALAQEINNSSKSGEVSIYIKGKDDSYYRNDRKFSTAIKNPEPTKEYLTHSDTPWIMYYPKSDQTQTTIDEAPFGKLDGGDRCGGSTNPCTKNFIMRFNPCGKNAIETIMDSGVGEG